MNESNIKINDKINKFSFRIFLALVYDQTMECEIHKMKHATQNNIFISLYRISNESLMQPNWKNEWRIRK